MNNSFVFKLYFSSTFNYVQLNYKFLACIEQSLLASKLVWCHAFLQERTQKSIPWVGKKLVGSWEGAPKNMCCHSLKKKMEVESKKLKNNDFRRTSTWNEKLVICLLAVKHTDVT